MDFGLRDGARVPDRSLQAEAVARRFIRTTNTGTAESHARPGFIVGEQPLARHSMIESRPGGAASCFRRSGRTISAITRPLNDASHCGGLPADNVNGHAPAVAVPVALGDDAAIWSPGGASFPSVLTTGV